MRFTLRSLAAFYMSLVCCGNDFSYEKTTHSCEFKNFSGQVFENSSYINSCLGSDAHLILGIVLQEPLDTSTRKLGDTVVSKPKPSKTRKNLSGCA
jgi:hypothetical protein